MTLKEKREAKKRLLIEIHNAILRCASNYLSPVGEVSFKVEGTEYEIMNSLTSLLLFEKAVKSRYPIKGDEWKKDTKLSYKSIERKLKAIRVSYSKKEDSVHALKEYARKIFNHKVDPWDT